MLGAAAGTGKIKQPERAREWSIFCDLDGVLCDFDRGVENASGGRCKEDMSVDEMWDVVRSTPKFFAGLEWTADGKQLVEFLWQLCFDGGAAPKLTILTGLPFGKLGKLAAKHKLDWVKKHISAIFKSRNNEHSTNIALDVVTCLSRQKGEFSGSGCILIDDRPELCRSEWERDGGVFVHHTAATSSIAALQLAMIPSELENGAVSTTEALSPGIGGGINGGGHARKSRAKPAQYVGVFLAPASTAALRNAFPERHCTAHADCRPPPAGVGP